MCLEYTEEVREVNFCKGHVSYAIKLLYILCHCACILIQWHILGEVFSNTLPGKSCYQLRECTILTMKNGVRSRLLDKKNFPHAQSIEGKLKYTRVMIMTQSG